MRGFWSGTLTVALVSIPVELYSAHRSRGTSLRLVDEDGTPLTRRYVCPVHGEPLEEDELVRGYELEEGRMVLVTDRELEALSPEKSREIDLRRFVEREALDPILFRRAYFLAPAGDAATAYRLLAETLEETDRVGIGTFVLRGTEHLVAIGAEEGLLRAELLRFQGEVRSPEDLGLPELGEPPEERVEALEEAIAGLEEDELDEDELADLRAERLEELVEEKRQAGEDVVEMPREPELSRGAEIVDLMEVLKRRLRSREASAREALEELTKEELYERAQELDLPGRGDMSKEELVDALLVAESAS